MYTLMHTPPLTTQYAGGDASKYNSVRTNAMLLHIVYAKIHGIYRYRVCR